MNNEALQAKVEAEEANAAKSAFFANMTHEIRTPINGVIGVTDILRYTNPTKEQNEYLRTIRRSGENLLRIVNEILDFSKIEAGKMELDNSEFNVYELMDEILVLFASQRSDKNLDLACLIGDRVPARLVGDPHKLRQVMINLIGNAMKFTSEGGVLVRFAIIPSEMELDAEKQQNISLRVEVEDTGIGITEEQGKKLFKAFGQAETGIAKNFGGTGLGLTISAKLVELMGGKLEFDSEFGEGTRFFFEFDVVLVQKDSPSEGKEAVRLFESLQKESTGKSVLIADNGNWSEHVLTQWVTSLGMQVFIAEDSPSAIKLMENSPMDFIFYAIDWEDANGENLQEYFKSNKQDLGLNLILLGTLANIASKGEMISGNEGVITKPFQHSAFFRLMESLIFEDDISLKQTEETFSYEPEKIGDSINFTILLADDNDINQMVAMRMFSNLGFQLDMVSNGLEAVKQCEAKRYDIVFMDVNMPEMDGLEATRKLHEIFPNGKRPIIVAMTANAMEGDRESCLKAGMDDYLSKPFRIDELKAIMLKYGLRKQEKEKLAK